jgi:hypothetical protein
VCRSSACRWQNKQRSHLFSRFGFDVLWWTMTKSSSAYMICKKLYALLCKCQQHEKWWPMTNNFSLPTPSPKIWIDCLQIAMTKFFICWYDTVYKKLLLCPSCTVYFALVLPSSWEYNTDKQWHVEGRTYFEVIQTLNSWKFKE